MTEINARELEKAISTMKKMIEFLDLRDELIARVGALEAEAEAEAAATDEARIVQGPSLPTAHTPSLAYDKIKTLTSAELQAIVRALVLTMNRREIGYTPPIEHDGQIHTNPASVWDALKPLHYG